MQLHLSTLPLHLHLLPLLLLLTLTLISPILAASAPAPPTEPHPKRGAPAAVTTTAQYMIASFGLGLSSCRMVLKHRQSPFTMPICFAAGVGVGALTAGTYARLTYDDAVWAWLEDEVAEIWSGKLGMGVGREDSNEEAAGAGQ